MTKSSAVKKELPLLYSCSGCSNVAQTANQTAIELFHEGVVEMSCIAGVAAGLKSLVKKARSRNCVISLDGCELQCTQACLAMRDIVPTRSYVMTRFHLVKKHYGRFNPEVVKGIKAIVKRDCMEGL